MKTNKKWYPCGEDGCYYKLEDGVLLQCPMNRDGTADEGTVCEVDWDWGVDEKDKPRLRAIVRGLQIKE